jgi:hypothetical protein
MAHTSSPAGRVEVNAHLSEPLHDLLLLFCRHLLPDFANPLQYSVSDELWQLVPPFNHAIDPIG